MKELMTRVDQTTWIQVYEKDMALLQINKGDP